MSDAAPRSEARSEARREARGDGDARASGGPPRMMTLEDVADYLNVSVPQAYALVRSGDLPAIKLGGRGVWRVDRSKLEAYIERLHQETEAWARAHPLIRRDRD